MNDGPDSNLGHLLNDILGNNFKALQTFADFAGTLCGTISDIAGALPALEAFFNITQSNPLQAVIDAIQKDFALLGAADKAERIIARLAGVRDHLAPVETVLEQLKANINARPPLTDYERNQQIAPCLTALNALVGRAEDGTAPAWTAVYSDQIYWSDAGAYKLFVWGGSVEDGFSQLGGEWVDIGYQTLAPPQPPADIVFSYNLILPAYLEVVCILLAVGGALLSNFVDNYKEVLRGTATLLKDQHDRIANVGNTASEGIIELSPPGPWTTTGLTTSLPVGERGPPGLTCLYYGIPDSGPYSGLLIPVGLFFEYGAVETFSGYSSIASYLFGKTYPIDADISMFNKFQIRLLKKKKEVYSGVGLSTVWNTINRLKELVGDPPLPGSNFADWSFRELFAASSVAIRSDNSLHLSDLLKLLRDTAPNDTDPNMSTSFRSVLNPV